MIKTTGRSSDLRYFQDAFPFHKKQWRSILETMQRLQQRVLYQIFTGFPFQCEHLKPVRITCLAKVVFLVRRQNYSEYIILSKKTKLILSKSALSYFGKFPSFFFMRKFNCIPQKQFRLTIKYVMV